MPIVTVTSYFMTESAKNDIERACKEIWVSMNGVCGESGMKESDICGVAWGEERVRVSKVSFFYRDRGGEFDHELKLRLTRIAVPLRADLKTYRTKTELWFGDPEWSVAKCDRPHKDEAVPDQEQPRGPATACTHLCLSTGEHKDHACAPCSFCQNPIRDSLMSVHREMCCPNVPFVFI